MEQGSELERTREGGRKRMKVNKLFFLSARDGCLMCESYFLLIVIEWHMKATLRPSRDLQTMPKSFFSERGATPHRPVQIQAHARLVGPSKFSPMHH